MVLLGMMVDRLAPWPLGSLLELDQVELVLFAPSGIDWAQQTIAGLYLESRQWVKRRLPFPAAVYNRCYSDRLQVIAQLADVIGRKRFFNYVTRFDKWEIHRVLRSGGLGQHLPKTLPFEERRLGRMLDGGGGIVIKPRQGHGGKGVYLVKKTGNQEIQVFSGKAVEAADMLPQEREAWASSHLMQQEIPMLKWGNSVFDIRILMQKDGSGEWKVSGDLSRVAVPGIFVTNVCKKICYAEEALVHVGMDPSEVMKKLESTSLTVARLLERHFVMLGEISVDFALDSEGKIWIIEVNGKPDRNLFFALRDEALIQRILVRPFEYACYLASKGGCRVGSTPIE